jgi:hypothetical protein
VQILKHDARDCGEFCSETSPIAAAHGAGILVFKLTVQEHQVFKQTNEDKQAISYSKHTSWKKIEHFSDVDIQ